MFVGIYQHTLDTKNRIVVPSKFREFLKGDDLKGFFIRANKVEDAYCLQLFSFTGWNRVVETIRAQAAQADKPDEFLRHFASGAEFVSVDQQSRILVPQRLIDQARLRRDIVLTGSVEWIEVWNSEDWKRLESVMENRKDVRPQISLVQKPEPKK